MELPFRLPVLPSQCSSSPSPTQAPTPQDSYHHPHSHSHGHHHHRVDGTVASSTAAHHGHSLSSRVARQPLQESTGNAQHNNIFAALRSPYAPRLDALSSLSSAMPAAIPTPPVVPTQALGSSYAMSLQHQRNRHHLAPRQKKQRINPICQSIQYQNYRNRQQNKEDQKWPNALEEPFLDGEYLFLSLDGGGTRHSIAQRN